MLNPSDLTFLHRYNLGGDPVWRAMKVTHNPSGVSIQLQGHDGYFKMRRMAEEELERELAKRGI